MLVFVALLRAVNVGGTGKLPMSQLRAVCEAAGFEAVQTYVASGNVVFRSAKPERQVKAALAGTARNLNTVAKLAAISANPSYENRKRSG